MPSPNFGERKDGRRPDMILLHYTGMPDANAALHHLCSTSSQVSAHYFVFEDGRVVQMARRASLVSLSRRFDVTWFLGAIHKYRHQLGEVLVASFFLQLFALISPLPSTPTSTF